MHFVLFKTPPLFKMLSATSVPNVDEIFVGVHASKSLVEDELYGKGARNRTQDQC